MSEDAPEEQPHLQYQTPAPAPNQYFVWPVIMSTTCAISGLFSCPSGLGLPICDFPIAFVGIGTGVIALVLMRKLPPNALIKYMAIVGLVLCFVGILITVANAAWGAYLGLHPATAPAP